MPFEELHRPFRIDVPFSTLFDTLSSTDICVLVKRNIASFPNPFDPSLNEKRLPFIKHRRVLVDWMCELCDTLRLCSFTAHKSVALFDMYLTVTESNAAIDLK